MRAAIPFVVTALSVVTLSAVALPAVAADLSAKDATNDILYNSVPDIRFNSVPMTIPAAPSDRETVAAPTQETPAADTAPAQTPQTPGAAPAVPGHGAPPARPVSGGTLTIDETTLQIKGSISVERMPNGRAAIIFTDPTDLPAGPVEGFEPQILPDGRPALVHAGHQPFPPGASNFLKLRGAPQIVATGAVSGQTEIAAIPFAYRRTFQLKDEIRGKQAFGKERVLFAPGSTGFYGGTFKMRGGESRMLCLFGGDSPKPYLYPHCFMKDAGTGPYQNIGVLNNVPLSFKVTVINYSEVVVWTPAFQVQDGDFAASYDFKLHMSFKFWVDGHPVLTWKTDDVFIRDEVLEPDANGVYDIRINGGRLAFAPVPGDTKKAVVTFTPDPKP